MSAVQRIRIRLKAYDHKLIDQSVRDIIDTVRTPGAIGGSGGAPGGAANSSKYVHISASSTSLSPQPRPLTLSWVSTWLPAST